MPPEDRVLIHHSWTGAMESFVAESNRIEGIHRVTQYERDAHARLWAIREIAVPDMEDFVREVAAAPLRDRAGMNVRVGNHRPVVGGPEMRVVLRSILDHAQVSSPFETHVEYETLHPFMDGNGRSGRALWAWQMQRLGRDPFALGFLHTFYYQALDAQRR